MVFVHGDSFRTTGSSMRYKPNYLLERDVVLVVPNYRLDVLGMIVRIQLFLSSQEGIPTTNLWPLNHQKGFLSTTTCELPGNAGLLDVVAALEFVQRHIIHFGGDPARVTLFGQSFGGTVVSALALSPTLATDLFQRVIIQSGSIFSSSAYALNKSGNARAIARKAELGLRTSMAHINREFVKMDLVTLLNASDAHYVRFGLCFVTK